MFTREKFEALDDTELSDVCVLINDVYQKRHVGHRTSLLVWGTFTLITGWRIVPYRHIRLNPAGRPTWCQPSGRK